MLDLEELHERDLDAIRAGYVKLAALARRQMREGGVDTGTPEVKGGRRA
jgi:hypothetical protein